MRDWIISLESMLDHKLRKWKKDDKMENGEVVQLRYQFEQTHILIEIFWHDKQEIVQLQYLGPRSRYSFLWHGLDERTFDRVMDRVGNLAQTTMFPPLEPKG